MERKQKAIELAETLLDGWFEGMRQAFTEASKKQGEDMERYKLVKETYELLASRKPSWKQGLREGGEHSK